MPDVIPLLLFRVETSVGRIQVGPSKSATAMAMEKNLTTYVVHLPFINNPNKSYQLALNKINIKTIIYNNAVPSPNETYSNQPKSGCLLFQC